jgi:hypothetical protein
MSCGLSEELNLFNLNLKGGRTSRLSSCPFTAANSASPMVLFFVEKVV